MRLERIYDKVANQPWAITPEKYTVIRNLLESHLAGASLLDLMDEEAEAKPLFTVEGKVAIVPIEGVILDKASGLEMQCGAFSSQLFRSTLKELAGRPDVETILLSIDSGGGMVAGGLETDEVLQAVKKVKKIVAYSDGLVASQAYRYGCQAHQLFLSASAEAGSIGVICGLLDESAAWAQQGLKAEYFVSNNSPYKAMGRPGTAITQEQRDYIQAGIDKTFNQFAAIVRSNRKKVSEDVFTAKVYEGKDAVAVGLADGLINDFSALVEALNK